MSWALRGKRANGRNYDCLAARATLGFWLVNTGGWVSLGLTFLFLREIELPGFPFGARSLFLHLDVDVDRHMV